VSFPRRIDTPDTKIHPRINKVDTVRSRVGRIIFGAYYLSLRTLKHAHLVAPCFKIPSAL